MIIAIDFDGTIARTTFPVIHGAAPYAVESINRLHDEGHYIIVWTCREGQNLLAAINWMLAQGIRFDAVNEGNPGNIAQYGAPSRKVYAHCYIDDRNLGGFPGWEKAVEMIESQEAQDYRGK